MTSDMNQKNKIYGDLIDAVLLHCISKVFKFTVKHIFDRLFIDIHC